MCPTRLVKYFRLKRCCNKGGHFEKISEVFSISINYLCELEKSLKKKVECQPFCSILHDILSGLVFITVINFMLEPIEYSEILFMILYIKLTDIY